MEINNNKNKTVGVKTLECCGKTIVEAAEMVGICRHTLMNYECGRNKVKTEVFEKLERLYQTLLNS